MAHSRSTPKLLTKSYRPEITTLSVVLACIALCSCGAYQAWPSPAIPYLTSSRSPFLLTEEEAVWLVSLYNLGDLLGNAINPFLNNRIGRKNSLLLFVLPSLIGWGLIIFAQNPFYLYIARFIAGLSQGSTINCIVIYLSEISDKNVRGMQVNMMQITYMSGIFFATFIAAYTSYEVLNITCASILILFYLTFSFLTETPYYYLLRERNHDAMKCLMKLRGVTSSDKLEAEMREMKLVVDEDKKNAENSIVWDLITKDYNRRGLFIIVCMKMTQFLSGSMSIVAYAEDIFSHSNLSVRPAVQVVIFNVIALLASLSGTLILDRVNRRFMFLSSGVLASICLASVGLFSFLKDYLKTDTSSITWLPLAALSLFRIAYSLGIGIIPFIGLGELFSMKVKGSAVACGTLVGGLFALITAAGYKALINAAGMYTTFWIFTLICLIGSLLTFWVMPNTTGVTLEEIQAMQNPNVRSKLQLERNMNISKRSYEKYSKI